MYTNIRTIWVYTYIVVRTHAGYEETYCEETWKSYTAPAATDDFAAAGFGGRGRSAGGAAAILEGKQEADPVVSGCRRSGMVQERGAGLPDEDQSSAVEANEGRENEFGRMSWAVVGGQYSGVQCISESAQAELGRGTLGIFR
jgi:hypothetical protein